MKAAEGLRIYHLIDKDGIQPDCIPVGHDQGRKRKVGGGLPGHAPGSSYRNRRAVFFLRIRYTGFKHLKDLEIPPRLALAGLVEWKLHNLPAHPFFTPKIALEAPRLLD